jgi:hypothetical protein
VLLYLAAKPVHVRLSDEGTGPPARHCIVLSLQWGSGATSGDVKPSSLDIWYSMNHMDTCATESYIE